MKSVPGTNYCGPFSVSVDKDDIVTVHDGSGYPLIELNTHTQSPLDDAAAMAQELKESEAMADFIADALNAHLEKK